MTLLEILYNPKHFKVRFQFRVKFESVIFKKSYIPMRLLRLEISLYNRERHNMTGMASIKKTIQKLLEFSEFRFESVSDF